MLICCRWEGLKLSVIAVRLGTFCYNELLCYFSFYFHFALFLLPVGKSHPQTIASSCSQLNQQARNSPLVSCVVTEKADLSTASFCRCSHPSRNRQKGLEWDHFLRGDTVISFLVSCHTQRDILVTANSNNQECSEATVRLLWPCSWGKKQPVCSTETECYEIRANFHARLQQESGVMMWKRHYGISKLPEPHWGHNPKTRLGLKQHACISPTSQVLSWGRRRRLSNGVPSIASRAGQWQKRSPRLPHSLATHPAFGIAPFQRGTEAKAGERAQFHTGFLCHHTRWLPRQAHQPCCMGPTPLLAVDIQFFPRRPIKLHCDDVESIW